MIPSTHWSKRFEVIEGRDAYAIALANTPILGENPLTHPHAFEDY